MNLHEVKKTETPERQRLLDKLARDGHRAMLDGQIVYWLGNKTGPYDQPMRSMYSVDQLLHIYNIRP